MTSNHSSYDGNHTATHSGFSKLAYFKQSVKQHYAAIAIVILTFCSAPIFQMFLAIDQAKYQFQRILGREGAIDDLSISDVMENYIHSILTLDNGVVKSTMMTLGILVACVVFSYLHSKKQTDFYHALPIKRSTLFWNQYVLGILLILPAYYISMGVSFCYGNMALQEFGGITGLTGQEMFITLAVNTLIFLLSYTTSVIANILVGNRIIGLLLSGLLLICFDWITMTKNLLIDCFMPQVAVQYANFSITKISPLFNLLGIRSYTLEFNFLQNGGAGGLYEYTNSTSYIPMSQLTLAMILYTVFVAILTGVGYLLFLKRPSESAGNCMSFAVSKPLFKYLGVVLVSITSGLLLYGTFRSSSVALYGGMALFAIIFHCTVEIIYDFDVKSIFKNAKSIVGCFIIAAGIVLGFQHDVLGIEKQIPKNNEVASVKLTDWSRLSSISNLPGIRLNYMDAALPITDPDFIDCVMNLHAVANQSDYTKALSDSSSFTTYIEYSLTNGTKFGRNIAITDDAIDALSAVVNTDLYAEQHVIFLNDFFTRIEMMEIYVLDKKMNYGVITQAESGENPVMIEFVDALLADINAHGLCPSNDIVYQVSGQAIYDTIYDPASVVEHTTISEKWTGSYGRHIQPFYIFKEYTNALAILENHVELSPIFTYENQDTFYPYFFRNVNDTTRYHYFDETKIVLSEDDLEMMFETGSLFFDAYSRSEYNMNQGIALGFDIGNTKTYYELSHYEWSLQFWLDDETGNYLAEKYDLFDFNASGFNI